MAIMEHMGKTRLLYESAPPINLCQTIPEGILPHNIGYPPIID